MDFKGIENLIKAMSESNLSSMDIEYNGIAIKMKKENNKIYKQEIISQEYEKENRDNIVEEKKLDLLSNEEKTGIAIADNFIEIVSPIVGTFYESPGVDKKPYAKAGDKVKKGDTVCIVEAMKVMNEIEAEVDGEIVEVLVENEQMVQYGEVLFKIKPL
ncbi:acetyl-CoA carboxylase biotin carboxyl carrier protein [Clostridium botulinum]|uniref:Biotin carboxyl carrier protein of acetyl-CoA carboxylase n=2 Tax=Clostridium botulinum TaxID=1491 RepID=C1FNK1_CLOBJ|nr:acetyl-CoA carboxylase biotin carboxyl carrier protein [Clostridium botulinum]ACO86843.1 acetyl-CoA carboxylase, biotin carboxyl carrier protein [Clostridium botulinum A2 str. Kyoto]APH22260.1 acetyl-CoA carboxylase, biotin carboxyl carrier protein [Clostridium botulinum]APQ68207.1 acetyl-CoA carboxylase, biotin carboxyl carrier protein [Clostridium botulinum]AUN08764.1 acetyl-CoA carboxylase, biotin carboxyl carrier protein [Clostridium botulinum]KEI73665.1 acetyl-CoA carboxylase [Clostrid